MHLKKKYCNFAILCKFWISAWGNINKSWLAQMLQVFFLDQALAQHGSGAWGQQRQTWQELRIYSK